MPQRNGICKLINDKHLKFKYLSLIICTSLCGIFDFNPASMNIEELREYCISKQGVTEEFPFDEVTLVFKVKGKIFAITNLEGDWSLALKCDPERSTELREQYPAIQPGYHMNKVHWNTVMMDGSLNQNLILELIDHSYQLVVNKVKPHSKPLTKKGEKPL